MSLLLRSDIRQYRFVLFYEPGYCVTRLLAFTARAIARFAANFALTAGDIVRLGFFAPCFAGFAAPAFAWNAAHRFLTAARIALLPAALSFRLGFAAAIGFSAVAL